MSGIVHFAGVVVDRPVITVRSGQLLATVEPVAPLVAAGDTVEAGQVIGVLEPGHCATACVHLGVRLAGEYVSPLLYLGGLQRAVLLPLG
jgi:murein DD-endopeptidase MepM/ murein hydrolase activator NlpD